jgi:hypothetical protein
MRFPDIDPRIKAWSPAKLRLVSTPDMLRAAVTDALIILQAGEERIAVLVPYGRYLQLQAETHRKEGQ